MKIDVRAAGAAAAALVGAGIAVGVITMSGHPSPTPVVIRPDAAVASTTTHASTPKAAQPAGVKPAVKKPAIVQEANPVTSPTDSTPAADSTIAVADPGTTETGGAKVEKSVPNGESPVPPTGPLMTFSSQPKPPNGPGASPSASPSVSP